MCRIVHTLWNAVDLQVQPDHEGRSKENIGEIKGSLELLASMLEFFDAFQAESTEMAEDAVVPQPQPHVLESPSMYTEVASQKESRPQSPVTPDPVSSSTESPSPTPVPSHTDLVAHYATGDQPVETEAAQDVVVPASLPQVLTPAKLASPEESPVLTSPIPPAVMTPSSPDSTIEELGLAVQELWATYEQRDANLFQLLAAALDGIVKLGDNLKVRIHAFASLSLTV